MEERDRQGLMQELRGMMAGRGDGIDLDSPQCWVVQGAKDPVAFFRHLPELIPADSILYFEGRGIPVDIALFYESHRASDAVRVVRDCIYPPPDIFHVALSQELLAGLMERLGQHPLEACFFHVKAYREQRLLFTFHDAFDGADLLVADFVSEDRVQTFCSSLGCTFRLERWENKRPDAEYYRRILWAFENPEKLRILWPWWKKLLFCWKKPEGPG